MAAFEYRVKDSKGKDQTGVQEAPDVATLVSSLRSQGYIVVKIQELKDTKAFSVGRGSSAKPGKRGKVKLDDLVVFSRQMATLVEAGIPLIQALDILADQVDKDSFKTILRAMHQDVTGGKSFSEAMGRHDKVFSQLYINMVRAGETSGSLEEILDRVANYLEKTSVLQKKVKSALTYPISVTAIAFLITFGMMTFVIPKFGEIFDGLGAPLPAPTRILIDFSNYLAANWVLVLGGIGGFIFLFMQVIRTPPGRLAWDGFKLKMPIFGQLFQKVAVSKFARTLATLVRSGVPILSALEIVSKTAGNRKIEKIILSLTESVKKGESISKQLGKHEAFPTMVVRMIAVGEETGELEEMLMKIADFYEAQVDAAVSGLTSLIEPLIILFLGVVIGGIVIAMFLPILTLTQHIK
ncbi:MAG: type II secretion system F family protein [Candidatus Omnitrophota bacterium]|nr:type II secretion system F family protein [Candidatus Omnitrophota bacterium]